MKKNNVLIIIGYALAMFCFLTSLFFRFYLKFDSQSEIANNFLGIGGDYY